MTFTVMKKVPAKGGKKKNSLLKNGLLEKWPPRKVASLKYVGMKNWPVLIFLVAQMFTPV